MLREEAIKSALKFLVRKQQEQGSWGYSDNDDTNEVSWDEVLEWVDRQTCINCISRQAVLDLAKSGKLVSNGNYKSVCDAINGLPSVEPETCRDCISRQAALGLKTIAPIAPVMNGEDVHYEEVIFVHDLEKLPSVEPERKTGKWKYTTHHCRKYMICSQCGAERIYDHSTGWNYCPMCGNRMEVDG